MELFDSIFFQKGCYIPMVLSLICRLCGKLSRSNVSGVCVSCFLIVRFTSVWQNVALDNCTKCCLYKVLLNACQIDAWMGSKFLVPLAGRKLCCALCKDVYQRVSSWCVCLLGNLPFFISIFISFVQFMYFKHNFLYCMHLLYHV